VREDAVKERLSAGPGPPLQGKGKTIAALSRAGHGHLTASRDSGRIPGTV